VVRGYQNEFKQALLNLISNSLDAVQEKGRPGETAAAVGLVTVTVSCEKGMTVVEVRANGCGIPATGLGLYMTKLIVEESLGGNICFASGPEGTSFWMVIARDDAEEAQDND
jgi:signal transduction histidine kinase